MSDATEWAAVSASVRERMTALDIIDDELAGKTGLALATIRGILRDAGRRVACLRPHPGTSPVPCTARRCPPWRQRTEAKERQCLVMCTPVILADRFPFSTHDTPTSTHRVIIAGAE